MRKLLISLLVLLLVIVVGVIVSVRFFPQLYVSAFNKFSTDQKVSIDDLNVRFFPLGINAKGVGLIEGDLTLAKVEGLSFTAQLVGFLQGKNNFWKADISNVDVQLHQFSESSDDSDSDVESEKINIHQILSSLNLKVDDVHVQLDNTSHIKVNYLETSLNNDSLSDYTSVEQTIRFSLGYYTNESVQKNINIEGLLTSQSDGGVSKVGITVPNLDMQPMLDLDAANDSPDIEEDEQPESLMDWEWLSLFEPLKVSINLGEVVLSEKSHVREINLDLSLDQSIDFTQTLQVAWLDSEEFSFEDTISINGEWQPTSTSSMGADLRGKMSLATSVMKLAVTGDVNVNGVNGNDLSIELESTDIPFKSPLLDAEKLSLISQYVPLKALMSIKQSDSVIDATIDTAKFGESDVKGGLALSFLPQDLIQVKADLQSELFSFQGSKNEEGTEKTTKERTLEPLPEVVEGQEATTASDSVEDNGRIFNDDTIDFSWLDDYLVNFNWQAQKVIVDDYEISDFKLPILLTDSTLLIEGLGGDIAGGSFDVNTALAKKDELGNLKLKVDAKDVVLEKLNLLPPEELKKGVTNASIDLSASGDSTQAFASSLNGLVKVNVGDGVIGNDSFELIGSDLILSLLNKLNPFAKKNKTTNLECAVVNLKVEDGKINIKKSLALRTSKLTMVANGHVDLNSEKIKLSLTPKARSGVGVDVSSLVKFIALGGSLSKPSPTVTASGILKSAVVVGAAVSTGGVSLLATSAAEKTIANVDVCKRADNAFK